MLASGITILNSLSTIVATYLRTSLTVRNILWASQLCYGEGGEAAAHKKSCSPLALSIFPPSYCDVAQGHRYLATTTAQLPQACVAMPSSQSLT